MDDNKRLVDLLNKRMEQEVDPSFLKPQTWLHFIIIAISVLALSVGLVLLGYWDLEKQALPNVVLLSAALSLFGIIIAAVSDLIMYWSYRLFKKRNNKDQS